MACPAIITGDQFLVRVLGHIDCQAQYLGTYGYQALSDPSSAASVVMTALLTLFVAFFGIRFLFGPQPGARDTVYDIVKVGLVITLAFSWPAFRTVIHDVVIDGPAQITAVIVPPALNEPGESFETRLQNADVAMVQLTELGSGRNIGAFIEGSDTGAGFAGTALQDDTSFGYARLTYLSSVIASLALLRLTAGLLLALAPLAAGLLLFEQTRGVFAGWLRGLVLAMIGMVGVTIVLATQLSILEPWLADAMRVRALGYAVPSAPMELFALNAAFLIVQLAIIWLLAKIAFNRGWISIPAIPQLAVPSPAYLPSSQTGSGSAAVTIQNRAQKISDSVETLVRREHSSEIYRTQVRTLAGAVPASDHTPTNAQITSSSEQRLGTSFRRSNRRGSQAASRRDTQS